MAQVIQEPPRGLLSLLGIKSLGVNPDQLSDGVLSMLDLLDFYTLDGKQMIGQTQNAVTVVGANYATITIPDGEIWLVYAVSSQGIVRVGGSGWTISPVITQLGGPVTPITMPLVPQAAYADDAAGRPLSVNDEYQVGFFPDKPLLVRNGYQFGTRLTDQSGAGNLDIGTFVWRHVLAA